MSGLELSGLDRLCVVLVRTRNPLNIGAAARAMQNFGVGELRVVSPYEASFREARSAVGAGELLRRAREFPTVAEAVADCRLVVGTTAARRREIEQEICTLDHAAAPLRSALSQGGVAMLFGSEKHGLTRADLDHCHWLLRIPAEESQPSMNLGQAVAVCLWEIARGAAECEPARTTRAGAPEGGASAAPRVHTGRPAAAEELERLGRLWAEVLDAGGAARRRRASAPEAEVRRLLRRLNVSGEDARLLMGVARRLLWRLQGAPER